MKIYNIVIISAVFPPEPVVSARLSSDIAFSLSEKHNITVLCPQPTRPNGFLFNAINENNNPYRIIHTDSYTCPESNLIGRFKESYSFGKACAKYIRENASQIDCIYMNTWPLFSQFMIVKIAKKYFIPCITHVQDIYPESLANKIPFVSSIITKILLPIDVYTLKNSTVVLCISNNMKRILTTSRNLRKKRVEVVSNWQDENDFIKYKRNNNESVSNENKPFTFMYLGNIGPVAGVELLIHSFINSKIKNSKLIIAGSGSRKKDCIELAKRLDATNIEFKDVPEGKVPEIQDGADVLLLPVRKNGAMSSIPSKLPAYMFSAKVIIGCLDYESDTAKAIENSGCGIVVQPDNESKLIKAMKEISLWNKHKLTDKGLSGFNYAMNNYSKATNLPQIISLIEETCNGKKRN